MSVEIVEKKKIEEVLKEPSKYKVIFHNDDYTTQEFVTEILVEIFHKTYQEAEMLMMKVHNDGQAVIGIYSYDIALTKVNHTVKLARSQNYPLRVTMEEE
jgi:ATP-dependent Clp protease adaptor protein ClpS